MYVHQHTKGELNQSTDDAVIGADAHAHSPPTQTLFSLLLHLDIHLYIYLEGEQKFPEVYRHYFTHLTL